MLKRPAAAIAALLLASVVLRGDGCTTNHRLLRMTTPEVVASDAGGTFTVRAAFMWQKTGTDLDPSNLHRGYFETPNKAGSYGVLNLAITDTTAAGVWPYATGTWVCDELSEYHDGRLTVRSRDDTLAPTCPYEAGGAGCAQVKHEQAAGTYLGCHNGEQVLLAYGAEDGFPGFDVVLNDIVNPGMLAYGDGIPPLSWNDEIATYVEESRVRIRLCEAEPPSPCVRIELYPGDGWNYVGVP